MKGRWRLHQTVPWLLSVFFLALFQVQDLAGRPKVDGADDSPEPTQSCSLRFATGLVLPDIPVAKTLAQQAKGLTRRTDAGPGMLFSWDNAAQRVFWMRDTPIPLSIGFFDADGVLFAIEDMAPESDSYHISPRPATDALELGQGQFQHHGLGVGTRLVDKRCTDIAR